MRCCRREFSANRSTDGRYNPVMFAFTEPSLATDAALLGTLQELRQREPIFHRLVLGTTRADFDRLMTPDFWEVGASGRRYSRDYVLDQPERRAAEGTIGDKLEATDFHCAGWRKTFTCLPTRFSSPSEGPAAPPSGRVPRAAGRSCFTKARLCRMPEGFSSFTGRHRLPSEVHSPRGLKSLSERARIFASVAAQVAP